jgi:hypothetical protein
LYLKKEGKAKHFVSRASMKIITILLVVLHLKHALVNALHLKEKLNYLHEKKKELVFVTF